MAVTAVHKIYAVRANTTLIDQVTTSRVSTEIQTRLVSADGGAYPRFAQLVSQTPGIMFGTSKIASVLSTIGLTGLKIGAASAFTAWFQATEEGGVRGSSGHEMMVLNEGLILPRRLSASLDGQATLEYEAIATWDGTNDPIVLSSSALAGTPNVTEDYYAGPVSVNGTACDGVQSIDIDFGIRERRERGDGDLWPTLVYIDRIVPTIRIRTLKAALLRTLGLKGAAQGATDTVVYLRKGSDGGGRVANATSEHVSFTIDAGHIQVREVGGSNDGPAMVDLIIQPTYDGTNAILAVDTAAAIS